jgi:hypothetical protein
MSYLDRCPEMTESPIAGPYRSREIQIFLKERI